MSPRPLHRANIGKLLMQHRTALYSYIFACVCNHNDAEDILQEVSAVVIESIDQLENDAGLLPWAREIARRRIQEHYRRSRREATIDPVLATRLAEAADRVEHARPSSVQRSALLACLEQLPDKNRQIISMRYDGSFTSMEEMAQTIGRTVQSTYGLIKRIKVLLRQCTERRLGAENST